MVEECIYEEDRHRNLFGEAEVYNPWSVTTYVSEHVGAPERFAEPYWANTSSNSIIKELIENADEGMREELDTLISGGTIEGYMKKVSERLENDDIYITMCIPNAEINSIYRNQIRAWFDKTVKSTDRGDLHKAVIRKDTEEMARILTEMLKKSISTFDNAESFYHGYLLSMLIGVTDYTAKSNREAGDGRPDIVLYPMNPKDPAYIFELKVRKKFNEMDEGLQEAFAQIRDKKYEDGILDEGYAGVISYAICFCKKSCIAGMYEPEDVTH